MLEDDEGVGRLVVDRGDLHHRGSFDRGHAVRLLEESRATRLIVAVAQDLDGDDPLRGLLDRVPDLSDVVAALVHRKAITAREDLADLSAAERGRGGPLRAGHSPGPTRRACSRYL